MCPPLWLIMPAGKPLYRHVETGTVDGPPPGGSPRGGPSGAGFRVRSKVSPLVITLERDRGLRAIKADIADGYGVVTADRFVRQENVWFPTGGRFLWRGTGEWTWEVTDLKVNALIDDRVFAPPNDLNGAIVRDSVTRKTRIVGGENARKSLVESTLAGASSSRRPGVNANETSSWDWSNFLSKYSIAAALASGCVLWYFRYHRKP